MINGEQKIRLLICDDQTIVCEGLRAIITTVPEVSVVGIAHNGVEAIDMIPITRPDLVLMDLKMPVMNGIQATKIIQEKFPAVRVLVLTTYDTDEWVIDAIRSGAAGYLLKDTPRSATWVGYFTRGLTVASVGLIFAATLSIGTQTLVGPATWVVFAAALAMMTLLKWNQMLSLLLASLLGILLKLLLP